MKSFFPLFVLIATLSLAPNAALASEVRETVYISIEREQTLSENISVRFLLLPKPAQMLENIMLDESGSVIPEFIYGQKTTESETSRLNTIIIDDSGSTIPDFIYGAISVGSDSELNQLLESLASAFDLIFLAN